MAASVIYILTYIPFCVTLSIPTQRKIYILTQQYVCVKFSEITLRKIQL